MAYSSLRDCVLDLERTGQLIRVREEVDPNLEMAEIHRRVFDAQGPALLFERVKGSPFQAVSNIYGTFARTEFIFRDTLELMKRVMELKVDPARFLRRPGRYLRAPLAAWNALPVRSLAPPVKYGKTSIDQLPLIKSWPMDGGAFVTLPQVFTLPPGETNVLKSNVGMYRIQLNGNAYQTNREIGLHYQIHRGIGVHHTQYNASDTAFRASVFVGGPPSHAFAAIMPLPEGMSELLFAGMLGGRRFRYARHQGHILSADADFVITGTIRKGEKKPEGPFGDHLGYYSLTHDFPVLDVADVFYRKDALWHFTVVGRPPQEDSSFGYLIHEIVRELTPQEFPGILEINAVDAAGVHPLLLAIGSERYMPFRERQPEEILTQANHILGSGQTSLAKFLFIAAAGDSPNLHTHDIAGYFRHVLERVDWRRDLHFYTRTTIDTLDYSGSGWNAGSKVVVACCGAPRRTLRAELPTGFSLPDGFSKPVFAGPGMLLISGPAFSGQQAYADAATLSKHLEQVPMDEIPLVVLCDDSSFAAATLSNFLWVTFTRANPSHDIHGVRSVTEFKHWGCEGALIIDARKKPHHAPELVGDPQIQERADRVFQAGASLASLKL